MRALITGSSGFVGRHLVTEFEAHGYDVIQCDIRADSGVTKMDIMDRDMIHGILKHYRPNVIINLAGQANVGLSWEKPQLTLQLNTIGLINILDEVRIVDPAIKVIAMGSSDEYGKLGNKGFDVSEDTPISPMTPYAISKQAQELFANLYVKNYGLFICMIRQFNLGGAGQMKGFMISDFASGIAEIEIGKKKNLLVGNLESARDYTHVKDACRAIRLISEKGRSGEVYNICSGKTVKAKEVLDKLIELAKVKVNVIIDPTKMRPSDTPVICGNHEKLTQHTGWMPELGIDDILSDALDFWRNTYLKD